MTSQRRGNFLGELHHLPETSRRFVQAGARGRGPLGAAERRQRLADRAACAARTDAAAGLGDAGAGDAWRGAKTGVKHGVRIVHVNVNRC